MLESKVWWMNGVNINLGRGWRLNETNSRRNLNEVLFHQLTPGSLSEGNYLISMEWIVWWVISPDSFMFQDKFPSYKYQSGFRTDSCLIEFDIGIFTEKFQQWIARFWGLAKESLANRNGLMSQELYSRVIYFFRRPYENSFGMFITSGATISSGKRLGFMRTGITSLRDLMRSDDIRPLSWLDKINTLKISLHP